MSGNSRVLLLDDDRDSRRREAWLTTLRTLLRIINFVLALIGCAMIVFAVYTYFQIKQSKQIDGFPWFIFAFGAAGILVLVTASTALVGVAHNSSFCLGLYSFLMVALLMAQLALAIAFFADHSWEKRLPHDATAESVARFLKKRLNVARWFGLAALIIQVLSIMLAYALSNGQQRLLQHVSDDEEEIWGRRSSLSRHQPRDETLSQDTPPRQDAWSQRMRSKYGLNVDNFTYDPTRSNQQAPSLPEPSLGRQSRRCSIM